MKDYYEILSVPSDASQAQIRAAFRQKALNLHPDRLGKVGYDSFLEVKEAYEILINREKRGKYDQAYELYQEDLAYLKGRKRKEEPAKKNGWDHFGIKKESKKKFSFHQPNATINPSIKRRVFEAMLVRPDSYIETDLDVGATLDVALEKTLVPCLYPLDISQEFNHQVQEGRCFIKTPPRLYEGATLLVPGMGLYCNQTHRIGNLLIEISLLSHTIYKVSGSDLHGEFAIMPWDIALKNDKKIPTIDGCEVISINNDFLPKTLIRFEKKGLYDQMGIRGDLLITLKLEIPSPLTPHSKQLWAKLALEYEN